MLIKQKLPDTEEGKREAIIRAMFGGTKIISVGNSLAVILPKAWVRLFAWEVDGSLWVKLSSEPGVLVVSEIDKEAAKKMMEKNKCLARIS